VTIGNDAETGPVTLVRSDGRQVTASATFTVVPKLTKLESDRVNVGGNVVIDGVSLGSQSGTVQVAGASVQPQLWSRDSVLFALPASVKAGSYKVNVVNAAGTASNGLTLTVLAAPATPNPGASATAKPAVVFDLNHQFVKPPKPVSPVDLSVSADPKSTEAGGTATVTVTLKLNGKPVSGAQVKLSMLFSPDTDYTFTPDSGATSADGTFKSTMRVSKKPGNNIVLAQSGLFSDQDQVVGTGKDTTGGATTADRGNSNPGSVTNPASFMGALPLVGLGVAAAALVAIGLFINMRSHGAKA
jgi:hypothetical protein